jgi:hypothetical protein
MRIQDCCESIWQCTWKVVCSLSFLIVVVVMATCIIFIPRNSGSNDSINKVCTPAPFLKAGRTNTLAIGSRQSYDTPTLPSSTLPAPIVKPQTVEGRVAALQTNLWMQFPPDHKILKTPSRKRHGMLLGWRHLIPSNCPS